MQTKSMVLVVGLCAGLGLSGCDKVKSMMGGGKPTGQVVATVDGQEITALELRREMGGFSSRDEKVMKQAQQQVLQRIILRKLLVEKAKADKLDKTPNYNLDVKRGEESLLAELYQRNLASKVVAPTKAEAEAFIASNPAMFADRKVLVVDQLVAAPNKIDPARFQPLKSLEDVKALLQSENVAFQESVATLDTLQVNPQLIAQIQRLPPGEVFVIPQRGSFVFNRITGSKAAPFGGDPAIQYATNTLRTQKAQQTVGKQMEAMYNAAKPNIKYAPAFEPPKPPPAKGAAPAAAAPAAKP
ncbi:MAG: EpsD family peptidyl-prolyl cis-trans isomerase [Alphaproteobacteria bacterium]|nr:EpsD family peptidyl-prolyl cis-trans isomerase [Alphaproteobacteria bacterium]MBU1512958.1 EpsD family peptidyl-prolyl cis-trans isomerase [Alphaproteobacteria bacterium]MBU2094868.1 EpsD family peptidyl-prolyl cis-trans isomerase [Alphaproteobacteria bacterium]MBU2152774.1 EpsD family peptidyl-prolyl cis-trans isomerase [Alphaproteobacteria bacterium]MBU2363546.1 EpsD family peptidyl-prolyl cis-trans isomerase [Alphaproteobacteria bacterium]